MKKGILLFYILCSVGLARAQEEIKMDTSESLIKWTGSNLFKFNKHHGTVNFKSGVILKDKDSLSGGRFEIDMNSMINTDGKYNEMLVWHLKNEDFFNVEKYPSAKLEITGIKYSDSINLDIEGNLTIKNITEPIVYKAILKHDKDKLVMTAKFIIDRTRWKVNYESKSLLSSLKDDTISDAIEFEVTVVSKNEKL
tara:strand:- start:4531 stop:5118 length:588 start_codon:yes stop_codon:yes gene_type:complete